MHINFLWLGDVVVFRLFRMSVFLFGAATCSLSAHQIDTQIAHTAGVACSGRMKGFISRCAPALSLAMRSIKAAPGAVVQACRLARVRARAVPARMSRRLGREVLDAAIERSKQFARKHPYVLMRYGMHVIVYTVFAVVVAKKIAAIIQNRRAAGCGRTQALEIGA